MNLVIVLIVGQLTGFLVGILCRGTPFVVHHTENFIGNPETENEDEWSTAE